MKLHLLRHAKTDQNSISGKDFDRKLVQKGKKQSIAIGEYFELQKFNPTKILCSSAARTRETISLIQQIHNFDAKIEYEDELYLAVREKLFSIICNLSANEDVFIIGHNDGLSDLATYLIDDFIDLKTCNFVSIEFEIDSWEEVSKGLGKIIDRYRPIV